MLTVVKFLLTKHWLEDKALLAECRACFTMLFNLIDFNDDECINCIRLVETTPKDTNFDWIYAVCFVFC